MAITFISQISSNNFRPSSNPINITLSSNNVSKCNFKYIIDLYINDTKVFRYKLFPEPSSGYAFAQLSDVISDYLENYPIDSFIGGISPATNLGTQPFKSAVKVYIKVGEEYDNSLNCDGVITLYPDLVTSNTFFVYYGAFSYLDYPSYNPADYVTNHTSGQIKFLTYRPRETYTATWNDSIYFDYLCSSNPITTGFGRTNMVVVDDQNNIFTFPSPTISINYKRLRIACGPHNLNTQRNDTIITAQTKWYDVYIVTGSTQITEKIRVNLVPPKKYRTRIGFINQLGAPEHITFYHRNRASIDIDRRNYKQYLTRRVGNDWTYQIGDRQLTTFGVNANERHTVSSFVSPKQSEWLTEMWLSNNIWIEDRPRFYSFRSYRENSSPTSKMLFWVDNGHEITTSNSVFVYGDNADYDGKHPVISVVGNVVDLGFTANIYPNESCGWLVISENPREYPIVAEDNSIEIQEKTGGLITYTFNYIDSPNKITLK